MIFAPKSPYRDALNVRAPAEHVKTVQDLPPGGVC